MPSLSLLSVALLTLCSDSPAPTSAPPLSLEARQVVIAFISTIDAATQARTLLPWDNPARLRWSPFPGAPRPGLSVAEMTTAQRGALHTVLRSVLSTQGYHSVVLVMLNQDLIAKNYPGEDENSGRYTFAIYGDPRKKDTLWSWRLGGHHVSMHFTFRGAQLLSTTPFFLGIDHQKDRTAPARDGLRVFARRLELGREWVAGLGEGAAAARLATPPGECWIENASDRARAATEGVAAKSVPEEQRRRLLRIAFEYFRDLDPDLASPHEEALRAKLDDLRFAWAGSSKEGEPFYYRLFGGDFSLELYLHDDHIHSIWHRIDDYGQGR